MEFLNRKKGKTTMKNILSKVLATSMALTLTLASAVIATPSNIKAEEIPAKAPAAVHEAVPAAEEARAEVRTNAGLLKAAEQKIVEEAIVEVVKAAPVIEKAEEVAEAGITVEVVDAEEVAEPAPVIEEAKAEPVKVWDVSATENDNVSMKFYADEGSVNKDLTTGEVVISGTGAMEDAIYTNFMSIDSYLTAAKSVFEKYYETEVELVYDEAIDNLIELDRTLVIRDKATGEELRSTPEMMAEINLADFLEFSPTKITIEEGITSVSEHAFLACADLKEVVLPSTVETISVSAFQYCTGLERVVMHEDTVIENSAFYNCYALTVVELADDAYYESLEANDGIAVAGATRILDADDVLALVNGECL